MTEIIKSIALAIVFTYYVQSLEPLGKENEGNSFSGVVRLLSDMETAARRADNAAKQHKSKLIKRMTPNKMSLRQTAKSGEEIAQEKQADLVEKELKVALSGKLSALLDHPYLEHAGINDFLVLRPEINDPFVTIAPNAMYYNIEKKCVNWLDDCSLKGMRERLLRGVQSPYT